MLRGGGATLESMVSRDGRTEWRLRKDGRAGCLVHRRELPMHPHTVVYRFGLHEAAVKACASVLDADMGVSAWSCAGGALAEEVLMDRHRCVARRFACAREAGVSGAGRASLG